MKQRYIITASIMAVAILGGILLGRHMGMNFSKEEIESAIHFQEKYYKTHVETL